ncbi:MAG: proteophosphoglycan 5 [Pseudomonadota bacterium]
MTLQIVDIPSPRELRGGWAALSAVLAAAGLGNFVYADARQWYYHDGGGNWACLRFIGPGRIVLVGHDHEYSETYFRESAAYFGEGETDLLAGAPDWWGTDIGPSPFGEWIGFVYGWNGQIWQRADYDLNDGFTSVGLLKGCSIGGMEGLKESAADAPGLDGEDPDAAALSALIAADGNVTRELLEAAVPGWDIDAGVAAARAFLRNESLGVAAPTDHMGERKYTGPCHSERRLVRLKCLYKGS